MRYFTRLLDEMWQIDKKVMFVIVCNKCDGDRVTHYARVRWL